MEKIIVKSTLRGKCLENKDLGLFTVCSNKKTAIGDIIVQLVKKGFVKVIKKGAYYHTEIKRCEIINQYGTVLFSK